MPGTGTVAVVEYERWMDDRNAGRLEAIRVYNEGDCRATQALRDWLLQYRPAETPWFELPAPAEPAEEDHAGREARPVWWWFFERQQMTVDELVDDADSIGRPAPVGRPRPDKQSMLHQRVEAVARRAGQPRDHRDRHAYSSSGLQPTRSAHTDAAS